MALVWQKYGFCQIVAHRPVGSHALAWPEAKRNRIDLCTPRCAEKLGCAQMGLNQKLSHCDQNDGRCHAVRGNAQNMGGLVEGWHEWSFWNSRPPLSREPAGAESGRCRSITASELIYPNLDFEPATTRRIAGSVLLRNHVAKSGAISAETIENFRRIDGNHRFGQTCAAIRSISSFR